MRLQLLPVAEIVVACVCFGCASSAPSERDDGPAGQVVGQPGTNGGSPGTPGGGSGTTGSASGGGTPNNPVGEAVTLTIEPFDVQPGTERQVCKIVNLPADVPLDAVRLHSTMQGTSHHFNVYKLLGDGATGPVTGAESTVHDCEPASEQLAGNAAFFYGSAVPEKTLETPPGVAFHLEPGLRIILEQHVINPTGSAVQGGVTFELVAPAPGHTIEHHADVMWFANWGFFLPPNTETSDTEHCAVPYDVEVFGLSSHTHGLGAHFSIETWSTGKTGHVYDSTDWKHPAYMELDPPISLAAGEGLEWTCTWKNVTPQFVGPGKTSTDEMCIAFAAAYPRATQGGEPIQCNQLGF